MSYVFGAVLLSTGGAEHDMAVEIQACSPRTVEGETRQRVFLRVALEDETLFDPKQGPRQVRQARRTWFIRRLVWINSLAWISTSETCDCLNPALPKVGAGVSWHSRGRSACLSSLCQQLR